MGWQALVDDDGNDTGQRVGDGPWDVMGQAFADVIALYRERYSRPPTREELEATVAFVFPRAEELFVIEAPPSFAEAEAGDRAAAAKRRAGAREVLAIVGLSGLIVAVLTLLR